MRRPILAFALTLCLSPALAQVPSPATPPEKIDPGPVKPDQPVPPRSVDSDASATPPGVFALRRAGTWEADGKKGFSRVVGVIDGDRQRLFAQWIDADGKIVATKEAQDDEAAKLTFGDVRAEPGDGGVTVFLDTEPDKDGMRDTWVMVLGAPGDVRFGPATN